MVQQREVAGLETTTTLATPLLMWLHALDIDLVEGNRRLLAGRWEGLAVTVGLVPEQDERNKR